MKVGTQTIKNEWRQCVVKISLMALKNCRTGPHEEFLIMNTFGSKDTFLFFISHWWMLLVVCNTFPYWVKTFTTFSLSPKSLQLFLFSQFYLFHCLKGKLTWKGNKIWNHIFAYFGNVLCHWDFLLNMQEDDFPPVANRKG